MISIIIPMYNAENYIEECIESALKQTYENFEVIVVNDGSTDNSLHVIEKFGNKIKIINKKNGGTASALNSGLNKMVGQWFKWLSADDVLQPNALRSMMDIIEKIPNNTEYIYYTNFTLIDENSQIISIFEEPDRNSLSKDLRNVELLNKFYGNGSTSLIHKTIIDEIGNFREGLSHSEDWEYWLRACFKYKYTLFHLPINTLRYRIHKKSLTSTKDISENWNVVNSLRDEFLPYLTQEQKKYLKILEKSKPLRRKMLQRLPPSIRTIVVKAYRRIKQ